MSLETHYLPKTHTAGTQNAPNHISSQTREVGGALSGAEVSFSASNLCKQSRKNKSGGVPRGQMFPPGDERLQKLNDLMIFFWKTVLAEKVTNEQEIPESR